MDTAGFRVNSGKCFFLASSFHLDLKHRAKASLTMNKIFSWNKPDPLDRDNGRRGYLLLTSVQLQFFTPVKELGPLKSTEQGWFTLAKILAHWMFLDAICPVKVTKYLFFFSTDRGGDVSLVWIFFYLQWGCGLQCILGALSLNPKPLR